MENIYAYIQLMNKGLNPMSSVFSMANIVGTTKAEECSGSSHSAVLCKIFANKNVRSADE